MGAFKALSQYYNRPLFEIAQDLNYSLPNIHILKCEEDIIKEEYPEVYSKLLSCNHNRDCRTAFEYAQDLVASWIFEDNIIIELQNAGLNIEKAGADKNREILHNSKISSGSDTKVSINNKKIRMEIMCDYKGSWKTNKRCELRDNKYEKLQKENSLFLGFDIYNKNYLLIDFSQPVKATYIPSYAPYGGKPVYSIALENKYPFLSIKLCELVEKIKSYN